MGMNTDTYAGGTPPDPAGQGADEVVVRTYDTTYTGSDSRTLGQLFSELSTDLSDLMRKEVMLAQAELSEKAKRAAQGAGMAAAGGFVAYAGVILLLIAIGLLLGRWMDLWLAMGIVAILTLVIGLILLQVGVNRLKKTQFKPEQTIDSLKENVEWAKEQVQ
jgi:hypothetical protein